MSSRSSEMSSRGLSVGLFAIVLFVSVFVLWGAFGNPTEVDACSNNNDNIICQPTRCGGLKGHPAIVAPDSYPDVPESHVYWQDIQDAGDKCLMIGYIGGMFGPDDGLLKVQAATVFSRMFWWDINDIPATPTFSDVPLGYSARGYAEALNKNGFAHLCGYADEGNTQKLFCPEEVMTKGQLADMFAEIMGMDMTSVRNEIMGGSCFDFSCLNTPITRGEAAGYFVKAFEYLQEKNNCGSDCDDDSCNKICNIVIVSDSQTLLSDGSQSIPTYSENPNWTAGISGATWVWSSYLVEKPTEDEENIFEREFQLPWQPLAASITIAADNSYSLEINGQEVAADNTAENYFDENKDVYNVGSYLHEGDNTIKFTVKNWALQGSTAETNPAGLLYKLDIKMDECGINPPPEPEKNNPPTISLIGDNPLQIFVGNDFTDPGATASDPEEGDMTSKIVVTGVVSTSTPGTYTLTYTITDSKGASASVTREVVVMPMYSCQLLPQVGRTVVSFGSDKLQASRYQTAAQSVELAPGNYRITLQSYDGYSGRQSISQPHEEWFVKLFAGGTFLAQSGTSTDLADMTIEASSVDVVNTKLPLISTTTSVVGWHGPYPDVSNPNSVLPVCAAFDFISNLDATNTPPVISLIGDNPLYIFVGDTFTDPGATASDNEDGDLSSNIVKTGSVNASTTGSYAIAYSVTDSEGASASTTRMVIVREKNTPPPSNTAPAITLLGDNPLNLYVGDTFAEPGYQATDLEDGDLTASTTVTGSVDTSSVSSTTLIYSVTDSKGLSASTTRVVNVLEKTVPPPTPPTPPSDNGGGGGIGGHRRTPPLAQSIVPSTCSYLNDYLKIDWQNDPIEVAKLQSFLKVFENENIGISGTFDQETFEAVERFQSKYFEDILAPWGHDAPTGFVYILTKKKVNEIYCNAIYSLTVEQQIEIDNYRNRHIDTGAGGVEEDASGQVGIGGSAESSDGGYALGSHEPEKEATTTPSVLIGTFAKIKNALSSAFGSMNGGVAVSLLSVPKNLSDILKYALEIAFILAFAYSFASFIFNRETQSESEKIKVKRKKLGLSAIIILIATIGVFLFSDPRLVIPLSVIFLVIIGMLLFGRKVYENGEVNVGGTIELPSSRSTVNEKLESQLEKPETPEKTGDDTVNSPSNSL